MSDCTCASMTLLVIFCYLCETFLSRKSVGFHGLCRLQICCLCRRTLTATKSTFLSSSSCTLPQPASPSLCFPGVVSVRLGVLPPVGKSKGTARKRGKRSHRGGERGVAGIAGGSQILPDQCKEGNLAKKPEHL